MTKSETLQLRLEPSDLRYLRMAAERSPLSVSDFARHELEPAIVSAKVADIARDFPYIKSIVLFGSMARGEHEADSDVDLAIETEGPYKWMGEKGIGRFVGRVEEATRRGVDIVKTRSCSAAIAEGIERDGRLIYER